MTTQLDVSYSYYLFVVCYSYHSCFKDHYKMIAIGLSKQQALDADPRAIQQMKVL